MSSLFEVDKAIMEFEFEIDEETGEILNADALDDLKLEREKKIEGVGLWYKNLVAEAEMIKAEAKNMTDRQKRIEKKADSLKRYLEYALQGQAFNKPRVSMTFRKSESISIPDETKIPKEFCNVRQVSSPDKAKIKKAIKDGKKVFGAELVVKNNLSVK